MAAMTDTDDDDPLAAAEAEVDRLRDRVRRLRQRAAAGQCGASAVSTAEYELHGAHKRLDALRDKGGAA
jgi:outer membrane protein TolC